MSDTYLGPINVILGPVAIAVGKYWIGVATGNRYCKKLRRTPEKAIVDATKLESPRTIRCEEVKP